MKAVYSDEMALDIKYRIKSIIVNEIDFVTKKAHRQL